MDLETLREAVDLWWASQTPPQPDTALTITITCRGFTLSTTPTELLLRELVTVARLMEHGVTQANAQRLLTSLRRNLTSTPYDPVTWNGLDFETCTVREFIAASRRVSAHRLYDVGHKSRRVLNELFLAHDFDTLA
jgi:hypothetical protein